VGFQALKCSLNGVFRHIPSDEILEMESWFRAYDDIEQESLFYCLGGTFPEHEQIIRKGDYKKRATKIRRYFGDLNKARLEQSKPPLKLPLPSKSKPKR